MRSMQVCICYTLAVAFVALYRPHAVAGPLVDNVVVTAGTSSISIRGTGFGEGAVVDVYDDFDHEQGTVGGEVSLSSAKVGSWEAAAVMPTYDDFAYSGRFSMRGWSPSQNRIQQLKHTFNSPVQTVYASYMVAIPPGYPFPGADALYSGFPTDSCWKFMWLIDLDYAGKSSDLTVPTYVGKNSATISGNDGSLGYIAKPSAWWAWGEWMRISVLLKANPEAPSTAGQLFFEIRSKTLGRYVRDESRAVFDSDGPAEKAYRYLTIPGWIRGFALGEGRPLYDDIYIASGLNAAARVEITDNSDYAKSTVFAIQEPESWSDTEIKVKLKRPPGVPDSALWLHVFNGDNLGAPSGIAISISESISPPDAPTLDVL